MSEHICTRRLFLVGAATTAAGALLAACGASNPKVTPITMDSAEITVKDSDVPVGSGIIIGAFILAQPVAGQFKAYSTRCPHQGRTVSQIDGLVAACPAHNSRFSLTDGQPVAGPAQSPLQENPVTTADGTATINIQGG